MALLPATNKQVPEHSILDHFDKQAYLGNQFTASVNVSVGTSEQPLMLISNAQTGSSVNLKALFINLIKVSTETAGASMIINVYVNPTITASGTAVVPVNCRPAYTTAPVAAVSTSPTDSAIGTRADAISASALSTASSTVMRILDNGQSVLITGIASGVATAANLTVQWYEL